MILETAVLCVKPGLEEDFVASFRVASKLIAKQSGYIQHELQRCVEAPSQFLLLVWWETLESHTLGFRQSSEYEEWKKLLHHYYEPFPTVEHYEKVELKLT